MGTQRKPIKLKIVHLPFISQFPVDGYPFFDGLLAEVTYDDKTIDYITPYVDITYEQYPSKPGIYKYRAYIDEAHSYGVYDTFKITVIK